MAEHETDPDFEALANSPVLAEIATLVNRLTGLRMALNVPEVTDIRLPRESGKGSPLCGLVAGTEEGYARCRACDRRHHTQAASRQQALLYTCHAGFLDLAVPIYVDGRHVATISSGQVLSEPPSPERAETLYRRVSDLPISRKAYMEAYEKALYLPRPRIRAVMRLIEIFVSELCRSARRIRDLEACLERPAIQQARAYIQDHFREPGLTLPDVAAAAGLSPAHFSHVFRQETGEMFTHFVQRQRITESKRLLEQTERSITQICFASGFNSLTHFNRVFRRFEHCSPSSFRQGRISTV